MTRKAGDAGLAQYHAADHPDACKFLAQVALHRTNGNHTRIVAWLREHEAQAILTAADRHNDVKIDSTPTGRGVLVQYFAEGSPETRTYRSTTRLHRRKPT